MARNSNGLTDLNFMNFLKDNNMGQYRFSIYFIWQLGLMIRYEYKTITIQLPFVNINICIGKYAYGVRIFGFETNLSMFRKQRKSQELKNEG